MKWVTNRIGKEQTWYSGDVIEKIKKYCQNEAQNCEDIRTGCNECLSRGECQSEFAIEILKILEESED